MRIDGNWRLCEDGTLRPVIQGKAQSSDGSWIQVPFLVDTGADRTVFNANTLRSLDVTALERGENLGGLGGTIEATFVETPIQLVCDDGVLVTVKGPFAAVARDEALDMSVLGRDITNLFTLIVDRQQEVVCLIGQRHRYQIIQD